MATNTSDALHQGNRVGNTKYLRLYLVPREYSVDLLPQSERRFGENKWKFDQLAENTWGWELYDEIEPGDVCDLQSLAGGGVYAACAFSPIKQRRPQVEDRRFGIAIAPGAVGTFTGCA